MTSAQQRAELQAQIWKIANEVRGSVDGWDFKHEHDIKGLFADFDTTSNRLGNTVKDKNARLAAVLKGVAGLRLGNFHDNQIDLFGDTLLDPHFADERPFDAIVSNPPYSVNWKGSDDPRLINDERFARIMEIFDTKKDVDHFGRSVDYDDIVKNDYNLSVSSYVEAKDTREVIDITKPLEGQRNTKRKSLFEAQDDVDRRRGELIAEIEAKLSMNCTRDKLFEIEWGIV